MKHLYILYFIMIKESNMSTETVFVELFGKSPLIKVLNFLITYPLFGSSLRGWVLFKPSLDFIYLPTKCLTTFLFSLLYV